MGAGAPELVIGFSRKVIGGQRVLPVPLGEASVDGNVDSSIARHLAELR